MLVGRRLLEPEPRTATSAAPRSDRVPRAHGRRRRASLEHLVREREQRPLRHAGFQAVADLGTTHTPRAAARPASTARCSESRAAGGRTRRARLECRWVGGFRRRVRLRSPATSTDRRVMTSMSMSTSPSGIGLAKRRRNRTQRLTRASSDAIGGPRSRRARLPAGPARGPNRRDRRRVTAVADRATIGRRPGIELEITRGDYGRIHGVAGNAASARAHRGDLQVAEPARFLGRHRDRLGCLSKCATASLKSWRRSVARSRLTSWRTRMRCTAMLATLPVSG